jgi:hypothetical protein
MAQSVRLDVRRAERPDQNTIESQDTRIPAADIGKSYQYSKSKMSDPSTSIDNVNVPEVTNYRGEFVYNFYTKDERIKSSFDGINENLTKVPRYASIRWTAPADSVSEIQKTDLEKKDYTDLSIEGNSEKLVSEDNFFNPGYISHTFSNIDFIEQGATDIENYSRISRRPEESIFKMSKIQIQNISPPLGSIDSNAARITSDFSETYARLADFPKDSLGLRVYDENKKATDEDDLLRSITDSVSLTLKVNNSIIPDIFKNSQVKKNATNLAALRVSHSTALGGFKSREGLGLVPVQNDYTDLSTSNLTNPIKLIGYVIDRYKTTNNGFEKEKTFYIEDIRKTSLEDVSVLYGITYVYAVRVVASVKLLTYTADGSTVNSSTIYVSSRPVSIPVECYEYSPPPEPNNIRFVFDYLKRNLKIHWDVPVNPQKDVKQFQVFRRKNIKEPFELIAQYGFDNTEFGSGTTRYKTGEIVDANNFSGTSQENRNLIILSENPIYMHIDEDFTVDPEFFISSDYIYSICSVDAHGMVSNYSSQHRVTFDSYKNKLITEVICDSGSPRQYPNMNLRTDAFKDTIKVLGDNSRKLEVYFTPEYLKVKDERNISYKIVEAQTNQKDSYYLLQFINLDNQKMQSIKIVVKDPERLTESS